MQDVLEAALDLSPDNLATFRAMVHEVEEALAPQDIISRFWAKEAAVGMLECLRLQEMETCWLRHDRDEAIAHLLVGRVPGLEVLLRDARLGSTDASQKIEALLAESHISEADIQAQAYRLSAEEIERLQRQRQRASTKLSQAVREIENRKLRMASKLRALVENKILFSEEGA